jgi:hypothetical protein
MWPHGLAEGGLEGHCTCGIDSGDGETFADAKAALCKTALLAHSKQGLELALIVDASSDCFGVAAAEAVSILSMAAPCIFLKEVGASTN